MTCEDACQNNLQLRTLLGKHFKILIRFFIWKIFLYFAKNFETDGGLNHIPIYFKDTIEIIFPRDNMYKSIFFFFFFHFHQHFWNSKSITDIPNHFRWKITEARGNQFSEKKYQMLPVPSERNYGRLLTKCRSKYTNCFFFLNYTKIPLTEGIVQ